VSYRGEKGKTTGYYVPKAAQEATREGVAAWQKMQECLRELAELNKERNLQRAARPIDDEAKVLVNHGLLGTGVSGARPHSAGWHVPLVAGFGLKPMVGSMQRTRVWLAHYIGCRKHAIRSGSCWTAHIFGPRGFME